ncbi:MAG: hypothetical protein AAF318_17525 [Pseudomonadota bacterium]
MANLHIIADGDDDPAMVGLSNADRRRLAKLLDLDLPDAADPGTLGAAIAAALSAGAARTEADLRALSALWAPQKPTA